MQTSDHAQGENQELSEFVVSLNEQLHLAGAERAEQAFGLGCGVGLLPAIALVLILYLLPSVNILLAITFLILILLILVGIVMLLSFRARRNAIDRTYDDKVKDQIDDYIKDHNLTRAQFDTLAQAYIIEGAPLRKYISPVGLTDEAI